MMIKDLSDSAVYANIFAMVAAPASVSTTIISTADEKVVLAYLSDASGSGRGVHFLIATDQETSHTPIVRVELSPNDLRASDFWVDHPFAALEARLFAPPDPDLLAAARQLASHLSTRRPDVSDVWIEEISDQWSKFRD